MIIKPFTDQQGLSTRFAFVVITLLSVFFALGTGSFHLFDWDEINFAECAREMIVSGNYTAVQMDFMPFWEKPPLFFWIQVACMKLFGINEFAARFPNALAGFATLATLFLIGKEVKNKRFGLLWVLVYAGSILPHFYFKSGIIDPIFNLFIFLGIYQFILYQNASHKRLKNTLLSGLFIGLAVLTKGPVGMLIFLLVLATYFSITRFKKLPRLKDILLFVLVALTVISAWWSFDIAKNGFSVIQDFIDYQIRLFSTPDAGHQQPWFYHFVVVLIGCFPLSFFALPILFKKGEDALNFGLWMKVLLWVVLILFTIVTTKIIHYSSLAYLPLSYLAVRGLMSSAILPKWLRVCYLGLGTVFALLFALPVFVFPNKDLVQQLLANDAFARAGFMQELNWGGYEFLGGLVFLISLIIAVRYFRKGANLEAMVIHNFGVGFMFVFAAVFVLPKIEQYVQGPAIGFYKEAAGKDVYLNVVGFKSYGRAFYSQVPPITEPRKLDNNWLVNGSDVDKTVMLVTKRTNDEFEGHPNLELKKEIGGFRLYVRKF